ncbi:MAG: ElyC/SanA/YdcF family protein [Planctomycetota bacterium]|nr:ElyC/SanA/YdcF family protein [Planctomycetota bacterium]
MGEVKISAGAPPGGPRPARRRRRALAALLAAGIGALLLERHVVSTAAPYVTGIAGAPAAMCILVPGAKVYDDGAPCAMLVDRLAAAARLYAAGAAPVVVVSGRGGGALGEDEVGAMRRWLTARGVPPDHIVDDPDGLRTIDSIRNCKEVLGFDSAVVVSNDFHVPRMVFLGRHLGLQAYGVVAPALHTYAQGVQWRNRGREVLARLRACVDVYL